MAGDVLTGAASARGSTHGGPEGPHYNCRSAGLQACLAGFEPPEFISDAPRELDAARAAGCRVLFCIRPGNREEHAVDAATIHSFDEIV